MARIIVNADDFGRTKEANSGIISAFESGLINRTTLMVNMPYADEAVEIAKGYGNICAGVGKTMFESVGLHLNITEGKPLTDDIRRSSVFCDSEGMFTGNFIHNKRTRMFLSTSDKTLLYNEMKTQIEKYKDYGFPLWHVDSHHHAHFEPSVFNVLRALSREYHFCSVRKMRNLVPERGLYKQMYAYWYNKVIVGVCDEVTDYFGYPDQYKERLKDGFAEFLESHPGTSIELMVHPLMKSDGILMDTEKPLKDILTF